MDVDKIAEVVLYEGYLLYPYRQSSLKNQQRWTFGGVYPRGYSEATGGFDSWVMQTQGLAVGGPEALLEVKVRFLQVVERRVVADGETGDPVSAGAGARLGGYRSGEEAVERVIVLPHVPLQGLTVRPVGRQIEQAAGQEEEQIGNHGRVLRSWQQIEGHVEVTADSLSANGRETIWRVTVRIVNTTPGTWQDGGTGERQRALCQTMVSTHTILGIAGGHFISLLDPPEEFETAARGCENVGTWPVLAGDPANRHTMLSSPIILYDYPQIAPESPGNFFDTTEIDELLALSVLTLTDDEKREMRETDPRAREILERTESLTPEQLMGLHGAVRELRMVRREEL